MVGGTVIEVAEVKGRPDVLFVDCRDTYYRSDTCAIYVERGKVSEQIQIGDSLWWQSRWAFWTPQESDRQQCGVDFDIQIPRVGYSGVKHPAREKVSQ